MEGAELGNQAGGVLGSVLGMTSRDLAKSVMASCSLEDRDVVMLVHRILD